MALEDDEKLAESVRNYPAIYDKSDSFHKDAVAKNNAWNEIVEECALVQSVVLAVYLPIAKYTSPPKPFHLFFLHDFSLAIHDHCTKDPI